MLHFQYSSTINAPVNVVWQFHERDDILNILTPPWQPVEIVRREGGLDVGAITEFRLLLGPINVPWVARHVECQENYLFVDRQINGPLDFWEHRHEFKSINGKTQLTDSIKYQLPGETMSEFLIGWWVDSRLQEMFKYRHQITKKECEKINNRE